MRILLDSESLPADEFVALERSLWESGKWFVVDRSRGYKAIREEQERLHRRDIDRFDDKNKFAHWGKLYGVGAIVVAHAQCQTKWNWWAQTHLSCLQHVAIIDSNTSEVLAATSNRVEGKGGETLSPSWDATVDKLNDAFPRNFQPDESTPGLLNYQAISKEEAQRQREVVDHEKRSSK